MNPTVAIFFGGTSGSRDLSQETGYWVCRSVPRSRFRVVPVHVTAEGKWQVPLGALPAQGSVERMMDMLWQAVPAVPAREGIARLLQQPVRAILTLLRGKGGDDGSLHALGDTLGIPVVGPTAAVCQNTSLKDMCGYMAAPISAVPRLQRYPHTLPAEAILREVHDFITLPFFVKPVNEEGSVGIERVTSPQEATAAIQRVSSYGDIIVQEALDGDEVVVTLMDDTSGQVRTLPLVRIVPKKAVFYDTLAKRRVGRVGLEVLEAPTRAAQQAVEAAEALYTRLGMRGIVTFDVKLSSRGPMLLEINTIPTLTAYSPLFAQLAAAHLHPSLVLQRLLDRHLDMNPEPATRASARVARRSFGVGSDGAVSIEGSGGPG